MPSTYTSRNRAEKQAPGENNDSWGALLNGNTIDMFDQALDGMVSFSLSGSKTLSANNGTSDEARCRYVNITGGTGGTVTIPNVEKVYVVRNGASGAVTFTTGSGTTCSVAAGGLGIVVCESGNVCRNVTTLISASDIGVGTLAVARGGTGVTTATGAGSVVLSASPTFTGTIIGAAAILSGTLSLNVSGDPLVINNAAGSTLVGCSTFGTLKFRVGANGNNFMITDTGAISRFELTTGGAPAILLNSTQVVTTRQTGWAAATGTATRSTFATGSVTLSVLAEHVKALIDDLMAHGLIGT